MGSFNGKFRDYYLDLNWFASIDDARSTIQQWRHHYNKEDRLVVLNGVAKSVIETQRGKHKTNVFTYRGRPVTRINNSGWKRARQIAATKYAEDHREPV